MFHCHILPHEDTGMMQNFLLLPAGMTGHGGMQMQMQMRPGKSGYGSTAAPPLPHHGSE